MSVLAATAIGAGISALTSMAVNAWNTWQTKKANEKNESLMRESWQREDEAVQRRVADLKAAGMSPLLAAGSAASTSGPISVNAPKSDFNIDAFQALSLASSLKHQEAETKLLEKEYDYYGKPGWYVALRETLGAEKFDKLINAFGDKLYDLFFTDPPSFLPDNFDSPGMSIPDNVYFDSQEDENAVREHINNVSKDALESKGVVTSTPTFQSSPSTYGITNKSLIQDGQHFIDQMRKDGKLSKSNIERIANTLASIYNLRKGDVFLWLMDLAGLEH